MRRRAMFSTLLQPKPVEKYIQFEDAEVERVLMSKGVSSDGVGITIEDAEKVTSIGTWFRDNGLIKSFLELSLFSNLKKIGGDTLGYSAFYSCDQLQSLGFPENVESIGAYCLYQCNNLSIDISRLPQSIKSLGEFAFQGVTTTGVLDLPNLEGTINWGNFNDAAAKQLEGIENLGAITSIAGFMKQEKLRYVNIPQTCNDIANNAFSGCSALEQVICRATTPPTLGTTVFSGSMCPIYVPDASLEAYKGATNWNTYADRIHPLSEIEGSPYIQFEDAEVERVLMANGVSSDGIGITKEDAAAVTTIGTWFKGNTAMTSFNELQYFTGMTTIPKNAFMGCTNLKSCTIPDSVTEIGNDAFASSGLESIVANGVVNINAASFNACSDLISVDIPNAQYIKGLDDKYGAFNNCTSLRYVNMPNARTIDSTSFVRCPIENDQILLYLETLGRDVFNYAQFGKLVAPKLKAIGNTSFYQCSNLEVMLLRDIESIAGYSNYETFRDCTKLKHFICLAQNVPSLATNVFRGTPINDGTGAIYVLDAKVDAYKSAANWSAFANVIKPYSQLATDNPTLYAEIQQYL